MGLWLLNAPAQEGPGQHQYDAFTLEITLETPTVQDSGTQRRESVPAPHGLMAGRMTPRWGRGQVLPLVPGPSGDSTASRVPFPLQGTGTGARAVGSQMLWALQPSCGQEGQPLPGAAGLAARQGRTE